MGEEKRTRFAMKAHTRVDTNFKGRDMYDLVWYMGKEIVPNPKSLQLLFVGSRYEKMSWLEMLKEIHLKAQKVKKNHVYLDLVNFIEGNNSLNNFLENYSAIIEQYCQKHATNHPKL